MKTKILQISTKMVIILFLLTVACKQTTVRVEKKLTDSYTPKYSKGFTIQKDGSNKIIEVKNPWQGAEGISYSYTLTNKADPKNFNEIQIPIKRAICMSSTHIAFIDALGEVSSIVGGSGLKYTSNEKIKQQEQSGQTVDVGSTENISYEKIIALQPDVIFAYGVENEFSIIEDKLKELGIKTVYIGDYLENSPLGKTEWLVPLSAFFEKEDSATKIFDSIENEYKEAMKIVSTVSKKPKVIFNIPYNDIWYMPSGLNYMSQYTSDAGADYLLKDNQKKESYILSIEEAYVLALQADFWIISDYSKNLDDVKAKDTRFQNIPSFKNKKVYNCSNRVNENGGNDFWESGVMNPHIVLKDFIKIYHPDLIYDHQLHYYKELN